MKPWLELPLGHWVSQRTRISDGFWQAKVVRCASRRHVKSPHMVNIHCMPVEQRASASSTLCIPSSTFCLLVKLCFMLHGAAVTALFQGCADLWVLLMTRTEEQQCLWAL